MGKSFFRKQKKNSASLILQDLQSFSQLINFLKIIFNYNVQSSLSKNILLMTMTKPNASADAEKNHTGYYKKALQRRKCSNSSAK